MKISTLLIILISLSLIIYFSINVHPDRTTSSKFSFTYRDGLFYEKNSNELFTGRVVDTADVIIEFEVSNGKKNGRFTTYYFEGGIEKVGTILDNKNEGTWKYYYDTTTCLMVNGFLITEMVK